MIHLLVIYLPVKFHGNLRSLQQLATILVFGFKHFLGACAVSDLNEILPKISLCEIHDYPSFVQQLVGILVYNFWQHVRVHVVSNLDKFWSVGSSCGNLHSCKIL